MPNFLTKIGHSDTFYRKSCRKTFRDFQTVHLKARAKIKKKRPRMAHFFKKHSIWTSLPCSLVYRLCLSNRFSTKIIILGSVTRWLDYFFNIGLFTAMSICPTAYKIGQSSFKILPNPNSTLQWLPKIFNIFFHKEAKFRQIWSHWIPGIEFLANFQGLPLAILHLTGYPKKLT